MIDDNYYWIHQLSSIDEYNFLPLKRIFSLRQEIARKIIQSNLTSDERKNMITIINILNNEICKYLLINTNETNSISK